MFHHEWARPKRESIIIQLDHLTVPCRDKRASAKLLAGLLGVPWSKTDIAPFAARVRQRWADHRLRRMARTDPEDPPLLSRHAGRVPGDSRAHQGSRNSIS